MLTILLNNKSSILVLRCAVLLRCVWYSI